MTTIFAVESHNYKVPQDTQVLEYFDSKEKCISFIEKEFIRITPVSKTELLPKKEEFPYYPERFEYISKYGNYPCAYHIKEIIIK